MNKQLKVGTKVRILQPVYNRQGEKAVNMEGIVGRGLDQGYPVRVIWLNAEKTL
jgi:hypothetical protein